MSVAGGNPRGSTTGSDGQEGVGLTPTSPQILWWHLSRDPRQWLCPFAEPSQWFHMTRLPDWGPQSVSCTGSEAYSTTPPRQGSKFAPPPNCRAWAPVSLIQEPGQRTWAAMELILWPRLGREPSQQPCLTVELSLWTPITREPEW